MPPATLRVVHPRGTAKTRSSRTRLGTSSLGSKPMREALAYLQPLLPTGWENSFNVRHAGSWWGLEIRCPLCDEVAPPQLEYGNRKWRWLAVHIQQCKKR